MELQSKILHTFYNIFILGRLREVKTEFVKEDISKILVVRNDNVGDLICSTPAIQALRENFPKVYIAVLVASYSQNAILGNPFVDEVFIYDKYKHGRYKSRRSLIWPLVFGPHFLHPKDGSYILQGPLLGWEPIHLKRKIKSSNSFIISFQKRL